MADPDQRRENGIRDGPVCFPFMIRFDGFGWRFADASAWALRDVSLCIDRGEFVTVAGPSGSGKSTLAQAMCGLLIGRQAGDPEGRVQVDGLDVATTPLSRLSQTIGLVQQNPETHFATLTVLDEVAFALENRCLPREEIFRRCDEAMGLLSIAHLKDRALSTLSGGEKQRVAVASLVAGSPQVLVLDEPTASLDPEASRSLFHALAALCRETGLTVVIIEHKLAHLLPLRPRLVTLEAGRVASDGPGAQVERRVAWPLLSGHVEMQSVMPALPEGISPGGATSSGEPTGAIRSNGADSTVPASTGGEMPSPTPVASIRLSVPLVSVWDASVAIDGRAVLSDVSLQVHPGEVVAVMGPNGGGKTTLLHMLLGLLPHTTGCVRMCDTDVSPASVSRLAEQVGLVFQNADHQLVADSVEQEALFTLQRLKRLDPTGVGESNRLLEEAGIGDRKADHPFRLSWGQKRRLNVISAVLHRPRLLLLDEPFAGQDWEHVTFLLDVIDRVVRGPRADSAAPDHRRPRGACLMVTHDPRVVLRRCTRLLFVDGGSVTLDAPVPDAFEHLREMGHLAYLPAASTTDSVASGPVSDASAPLLAKEGSGEVESRDRSTPLNPPLSRGEVDDTGSASGSIRGEAEDKEV